MYIENNLFVDGKRFGNNSRFINHVRIYTVYALLYSCVYHTKYVIQLLYTLVYAIPYCTTLYLRRLYLYNVYVMYE